MTGWKEALGAIAARLPRGYPAAVVAAAQAGPQDAPAIAEGADVTGAMTAAARRLGCTVESDGPGGALRVTWNGQAVAVPGKADPARDAAAVPLARLVAAAALARTPGSMSAAGQDATAWLILERLHANAPADLLPAPRTLAADAGQMARAAGQITAAALTVTAHCEKVLAALPPSPRPGGKSSAPPAARVRGPGNNRDRGQQQPSTDPAVQPRTPHAPVAEGPPGPDPPAAHNPDTGSQPGQLPVEVPAAAGSRDELEAVWTINEAAAAWFRTQLPGSWAESYMTKQRGFGRDVLDVFEIGYAPAGWSNLVNHLRRAVDENGNRLFPDTLICDAGLAARTGSGNLVDVFRDRVIFPIRDHDGHYAGFGARKHPRNRDKDTPKYINTRATIAFDKSAILYGLWQSRDALRAGAAPVLDEGYTDVMAIWCAGAGEYAPVASLGTSFTGRQATAIAARACLDKVPVLSARDPDPAGMRAAANDFHVLVPRHTTLARLVTMDEDPADLYLHRGAAALRAALSRHTPLADAVTDAVLARYDGIGGGLRRRGNYGPQTAACRAVARELAGARHVIDIVRQVARVTLAIDDSADSPAGAIAGREPGDRAGERWSDVYWRFLYEWYPEAGALAEEAEQQYDELLAAQRQDGRVPPDAVAPLAPYGAWAVLPPNSIERTLSEGPPPWEPSAEEVRALACRDDWPPPGLQAGQPGSREALSSSAWPGTRPPNTARRSRGALARDPPPPALRRTYPRRPGLTRSP